MRFAPASGGRQGKRGGFRLCYAYFESHATVLLVHVYGKTRQDDLTPQQKKLIRALLAAAQRQLDQRKRAKVD